jgi:hypothetical protein
LVSIQPRACPLAAWERSKPILREQSGCLLMYRGFFANRCYQSAQALASPIATSAPSPAFFPSICHPLFSSYSKAFADDLVVGLEGPFENLKPVEKREAWTVLAQILTYDASADPEYVKFCQKVAERLKQRADLIKTQVPMQGIVPSAPPKTQV